MTISTAVLHTSAIDRLTPFARIVPSGSVLRIRRLVIGVTMFFNNTAGTIDPNPLVVTFTPALDAGEDPAGSYPFRSVDPQGPVQAHSLETGWATAPSFSGDVQDQLYMMPLTPNGPLDMRFTRDEAPVVYPDGFGMLLYNFSSAVTSGHGYSLTLEIED